MKNNKTLLEVNHLNVEFAVDKASLNAVRDVSFTVNEGEILGIVGESGSGKSVMMKSILRNLPVNASISNGSILFDGQDLALMSEKELRRIRGKDISMVFQDALTSLNPLRSIGFHLTEVIMRHQRVDKKEAWRRGIEILDMVGISIPHKRMKQYPHELSGGMRQRVMIGLALSCSPKLLIADEPTTALDVTTQAQILRQLKLIQKQTGMGIVLITHDLAVAYSMCHRIMVMYGGKIMEEGLSHEVFSQSKHRYTRALLHSMPSLSDEGRKLEAIPGAAPNLHQIPGGCPFAPRCGHVRSACTKISPPWVQITDTHRAACYWEEG